MCTDIRETTTRILPKSPKIMELVTPLLVQNTNLKFPLLCSFHLDLISSFNSDNPLDLNKNLEVGQFEFVNALGEQVIGRLQILTFTNQTGLQDVSLKLHVSKKHPDHDSKEALLVTKDPFKGYEEFACFTIARVNLATSEKAKPPFKLTFYSTSTENHRHTFELYSHQKYDNLYFQFGTFPFFKSFRNTFVTLTSCNDLTCRTSSVFSGVSVYSHDDLLSTGRYSDLTITCCGEKFRVHKVIVCGRSPVIEKMVDTDMLEKENNEIIFREVDPSVFGNLLTYLYTEKCNIEKHPHELFKLAHFLEVRDLLVELELYLVQNIGLGNIAESMNLIRNDQYQLKSLELGIKNFVSANEATLLGDPSFLEYLCDSVEESNIVFILELAYKHNHAKLLLTTMDFVKRNSKNLLLREDYRCLLKNNSDLAIHVLQYISNFIV